MGLLSTLKEMFFGQKVDVAQLKQQGAIVVDVRTPAEYNSGHSKGSKNIPINALASKFQTLKNKEVILVCRSGARAGQAKSMLEKQGITAHNAGAWQNAN